ncbi:hypothetical protein KIH74_28105 [Kineosporia sp. J2-2]|uniref:RNA polymerase sigma-70 factor (ECF subfamily) n=1 Tax=Kineosporia corallincola TaxID=2835133 RepID=A0ABS5TPT7_9ACTN|nr:sigma factor-like helix-turn-helix DNA-binding protein [Kineosporia corallincola]MBT0772838.1 hypothetical protein [Kineosporia corallincola]
MPPKPADDLSGPGGEVLAEAGAAVLAYALGLSGDWHSAQDLVQEALLRLCQNPAANRWERSGRLLRSVVHNLAVDQSRRRAARPDELLMGLVRDGDVPLAPGPDPSDGVTDSLAVQQLLACLHPHQAGVVRRLYVDGLTMSEVAAELRIPVGTVKSRNHQALALMRRSVVRG